MTFTGIAATLLPEGKTVNKTLAPMSPRVLEVMDRTLRDLMKNHLQFGGKIVVFGGDFRQLLPVKENATQCEIVKSSISFSALWKNFIVHHLIENMRALPKEKEFSQFLLQMCDGTLNDSSETIQIPEKCIAPVDSDIMKDTYKTLIEDKKFSAAANYTILSARNIDVDINRKVVDLLDAETKKIYTSIDSTEITNDESDIHHEAVLPEYLNSLNPPSLPPHELRLRKYRAVMLIRNMSISESLCNGTKLLILDMKDNALRCQILTGSKTGEITYLSRVTLHCENIDPFSFRRGQCPIKLAFVMPINKSQGQTFDVIGIDLRKHVFNHGQLITTPLGQFTDRVLEQGSTTDLPSAQENPVIVQQSPINNFNLDAGISSAPPASKIAESAPPHPISLSSGSNLMADT
ncbi:ATP-dependent DNA helicase PIF1-like [Belonocnema kinseyi]|uniref:ATP-dependent DNA helicase PIF1-like n=1 Tax=Belonocnema kinseyi TaxID=2817044 RepID=UPI00143D079A|nr:ATP-dependent DNA helicase PIF1-like [Belonocnema kinseyi]